MIEGHGREKQGRVKISHSGFETGDPDGGTGDSGGGTGARAVEPGSGGGNRASSVETGNRAVEARLGRCDRGLGLGARVVESGNLMELEVGRWNRIAGSEARK